MEVIWNLSAHNSLRDNLKHLKRKWSKEVINNFLSITDEKIESLESNPYLGTIFESKPTLRKLVITSHITLFYEVDDVNEKIYLHLFWLNFKDPNHLEKFFS